jgi:nitroreductase
MEPDALLSTMRDRRSVRAYKSEPLSEDEIAAMVEAIRWAPSAGNHQCREFYFVRNPVRISQLAECTFDQDFVGHAPLVILGCADRDLEKHFGPGTAEFTVQDVAASVQNLLLVAHALGLGACWVCAFSEEKVAEAMGLPGNERPIVMVPVGRPDEEPEVPPRRSPEDTFRYVD